MHLLSVAHFQSSLLGGCNSKPNSKYISKIYLLSMYQIRCKNNSYFLFIHIDKVKFNQEKNNMEMKYFGKKKRFFKRSQHFCKIRSVQLLFVVASVAVMFLWKKKSYKPVRDIKKRNHEFTNSRI